MGEDVTGTTFQAEYTEPYDRSTMEEDVENSAYDIARNSMRYTREAWDEAIEEFMDNLYNMGDDELFDSISDESYLQSQLEDIINER